MILLNACHDRVLNNDGMASICAHITVVVAKHSFGNQYLSVFDEPPHAHLVKCGVVSPIEELCTVMMHRCSTSHNDIV